MEMLVDDANEVVRGSEKGYISESTEMWNCEREGVVEIADVLLCPKVYVKRG